MSKYFFTILIGLLFFSCQNGISQKEEKPNVLVLLVDDLGYHDLSCTGSEIYQTPNIDQLANESVTFTNAYANYPRCVPSRYALMTGTYPVVDGDVPDDGFPIGNISDEKNFIKQFNSAGYKTAFFGKWHLGGGESSPEGFGYEVSVAAGEAGSPRSFLYPFNVPKGNNKNVKKVPIPHLDEKGKEGDYLTDNLTDELLHFLKNKSDEPFMAVFSFYAVHQPLEAKKEGIEKNKKEIAAFDFGDQPGYISEGTGRTKMRQDHPAYAAMVENMDWNVGRILNVLEEKNMTENTIIIFTSDHGGLSNDGYNKRKLATSNFPLRAGKGWQYEGGVRVPLFVKYKKQFTSHEDNQSIIMLMDLFPTLYEMSSSKKLEGVDGKSFLPILKNKETWPGRTVYWHSSKARPRNTGENNSSAIRSGDWKLIDFYEEGKTELYNLKDDPSEQMDLLEKKPEKVNELLLKLNEWKTSW